MSINAPIGTTFPKQPIHEWDDSTVLENGIKLLTTSNRILNAHKKIWDADINESSLKENFSKQLGSSIIQIRSLNARTINLIQKELNDNPNSENVKQLEKILDASSSALRYLVAVNDYNFGGSETYNKCVFSISCTFVASATISANMNDIKPLIAAGIVSAALAGFYFWNDSSKRDQIEELKILFERTIAPESAAT